MNENATQFNITRISPKSFQSVEKRCHPSCLIYTFRLSLNHLPLEKAAIDTPQLPVHYVLQSGSITEEFPTMPFTTIDDRTALVVIDLQKGIAALPPQDVARAAIANAVRLIEAFRTGRRPVVLVNVVGGAPGRTDKKPAGGNRPADWAELLPELGSAPDDIHVSKKTWGAFTNTDLDARLRDLGVTGVVVCGIATSRGVESTARVAHELGYNVALPIDALADATPEAPRRSVELTFPWIAETGTTDELIALVR